MQSISQETHMWCSLISKISEYTSWNTMQSIILSYVRCEITAANRMSANDASQVPTVQQDPPQSWYTSSARARRQLCVRMRRARVRHVFGPQIQSTDHVMDFLQDNSSNVMKFSFPKSNSLGSWLHCQGKDKGVPVYVVKGYGKSGSTTPLVLNIGTRLGGGCADSFTARSLCPLKSQVSLPTEC